MFCLDYFLCACFLTDVHLSRCGSRTGGPSGGRSTRRRWRRPRRSRTQKRSGSRALRTTRTRTTTTTSLWTRTLTTRRSRSCWRNTNPGPRCSCTRRRTTALNPPLGVYFFLIFLAEESYDTNSGNSGSCSQFLFLVLPPDSDCFPQRPGIFL